MKKILLTLVLTISTNLFAQDWDDDEHERRHHKKDNYKRDYFTVGFYTGSYIGQGKLYETNYYFNSIGTEIEYVKFRDLSMYVRGIYCFTNVSVSDYTIPFYNGTDPYTFYPPGHYKMVISFGGRYYVRKEGKVKPYLQLGINQETQYKNNARLDIFNPDGTPNGSIIYYGGYNFYYFMNIGIGFSVKISERFSFDMKYDLNKTLDKKVNYSFNGFSVLAGIKYNL